mgnify:CR=1 FL=1
MLKSIKKGDRFLRMPEVRHAIGLSRAHIYFLISNQDFPPPYKLGARASGWLKSEVHEWMTSKLTNSRVNHEERSS